jgi:hypothetical protein
MAAAGQGIKACTCTLLHQAQWTWRDDSRSMSGDCLPRPAADFSGTEFVAQHVWHDGNACGPAPPSSRGHFYHAALEAPRSVLT